MSFHVYRLYDADGQLLYVGQTARPKERIYEHRCKPWGKTITDVRTESYSTRSAAQQAERTAIVECRPKFNKAIGGFGGRTVTLSFRLHSNLEKQLQDLAAEAGYTFSSYVALVLEAHVAEARR